MRNYGLSQLIVEVTFGGSGAFVEVLDYRDGKVVNLATELDYFDSHAEVRPQFRSGIHPAKEPYEILLTTPGLGGTDERHTEVYRYKDGSYRRVGQFSQTKVDDFIEQLVGSK